MLHKTECGRRAAATFARQLLELKRRGDDTSGRGQELRASLVELVGTFDTPKGVLGPWFYMPSGKGRKTPTFAAALRAWAKVQP